MRTALESQYEEWVMLIGGLSFFQATGVAKSILSISSPGTSTTSSLEHNVALTRKTNEFAADVKRQHPDRFGFFASLPHDNGIERDEAQEAAAALQEIAYAFDTLKADGIALLSNRAGVYLGDPRLRPVLAELDRRKALVFVHPTVVCCQHMQSHSDGQGMSPAEQYANSSPLATVYRAPLFEFFFDSARSVLDLIISGTILRFPRVRWIVSHCGNVLPSLLDRM